jgi:hypothetical protein
VVHPCASCAHDRGCNRRPAFPAPSVFWEGNGYAKPRAKCAARMRTHVPSLFEI